MKAIDFATKEDRDEEGRDWFAVDPDEMYPEAIKYAQSLLEDGASVPMYLQQHVGGLRAADVADVAWGDAYGSGADLSPKRRAERERVLESARLIYTALLREQVGGPIGIHITKNENWRL